MKRPLVFAAIGFAIGVFVAMHNKIGEISWLIALPITGVAIWLWRCIPKILPISIILLSFLYGATYAGWYVKTIQAPISDLDEKTDYISAQVLDFADRYEDTQRVRIRIPKEQLDTPKDVTTLIYLPLTQELLYPGDEICVTAEFYLSNYSQGFDRELYYRSNGIFILASAKAVSKSETETEYYDLTITPNVYFSLGNFPKRIAYQMREQISAHFTERQSSFLTALLLGDRSQLTTIDSNHLKKAGLSHVIAVSGLHVGFLISLLMLLAGRRIGSVCAVPLLLFFFLMVGWSPSIARASIMYLFLLASFWFRRQSNSLNALSVALIVILIYLPTAVDSVSLQLSFSATLGLILFAGRVTRSLAAPKQLPFLWMKKFWNWIAVSISCSLCTQIFSIPILLYYFGYISILSIPANLAVLWAVSLVFAFGSIFVMFSFLPIAKLLIPFIGILTDYIWLLTDKIADLPFGLLYYNRSMGVVAMGILYLMTALLLLRIMPKLTLPVGFLLLILVCGADWRQSLTETKIAFLSVGYGQAVIISNASSCILIDCGGSGHYNAAQSVLEYMDWNGIEQIDTMVLTSVDKTHARHAVEIMKDSGITQVILPEANRDSETLQQVQEYIETEKISALYYGKEDCCTIAYSPVTVLGGIERKLLVRISIANEDILIVHSATQNMLLDYLETHELTATTLVVSSQITEDYKEMQQIFNQIAPSELLLSSGWESATKFNNIPVYNLYEHGTLIRTVYSESR